VREVRLGWGGVAVDVTKHGAGLAVRGAGFGQEGPQGFVQVWDLPAGLSTGRAQTPAETGRHRWLEKRPAEARDEGTRYHDPLPVNPGSLR